MEAFKLILISNTFGLVAAFVIWCGICAFTPLKLAEPGIAMGIYIGIIGTCAAIGNVLLCT